MVTAFIDCLSTGSLALQAGAGDTITSPYVDQRETERVINIAEQCNKLPGAELNGPKLPGDLI